MILGMETLLGF